MYTLLSPFIVLTPKHSLLVALSLELELGVERPPVVVLAGLGVLHTHGRTLEVVEPRDPEASRESSARVDHQRHLGFPQT